MAEGCVVRGNGLSVPQTQSVNFADILNASPLVSDIEKGWHNSIFNVFSSASKFNALAVPASKTDNLESYAAELIVAERAGTLPPSSTERDRIAETIASQPQQVKVIGEYHGQGDVAPIVEKAIEKEKAKGQPVVVAYEFDSTKYEDIVKDLNSKAITPDFFVTLMRSRALQVEKLPEMINFVSDIAAPQLARYREAGALVAPMDKNTGTNVAQGLNRDSVMTQKILGIVNGSDPLNQLLPQGSKPAIIVHTGGMHAIETQNTGVAPPRQTEITQIKQQGGPDTFEKFINDGVASADTQQPLAQRLSDALGADQVYSTFAAPLLIDPYKGVISQLPLPTTNPQAYDQAFIYPRLVAPNGAVV